MPTEAVKRVFRLLQLPPSQPQSATSSKARKNLGPPLYCVLSLLSTHLPRKNCPQDAVPRGAREALRIFPGRVLTPLTGADETGSTSEGSRLQVFRIPQIQTLTSHWSSNGRTNRSPDRSQTLGSDCGTRS